MKQLWNPGDDLCAEHSLPGEYCPEGGKNAGIILFQKITFRSQAERFYYIFVIRKGGQKQNPGIWKFFQDQSRCLQSRHIFHADIHKQNIRLVSAV